MDLRRLIASSLRAAGLTGAGPAVPGAKEMPTLLGERARQLDEGLLGGWCWYGVVTVPVAGVVTEVSTTTRELQSEEVSVSELSPPVSAVVLPSPSVPLVTSVSVDSASWVLWDAVPSIDGASAPPPDDANAHKDRMTKQ
ncbi:hypothetical protein NDU88_003505 [Pleurodeles waltl]|uniref:Secreted protein n=1 Tax=Pleurodeles waltl TaxID=8319 RepID=A0AAV7MS09_PLEWA|nr:hypothetical protein NDU88_003505 [Pleurodeles waltl]